MTDWEGPTCRMCAYRTVEHGGINSHAFIMQPDVQDGMQGHVCPNCHHFLPGHPVDRTRVHGPARADEWPMYLWPEEIRDRQIRNFSRECA